MCHSSLVYGFYSESGRAYKTRVKSPACVHKFRGFASVWYSNLILDSRNVLQT